MRGASRPSMTAPRNRFGAHQDTTFCTCQVRDPLNVVGELRRLHVVGIASKREISGYSHSQPVAQTNGIVALPFSPQFALDGKLTSMVGLEHPTSYATGTRRRTLRQRKIG